MAWTNTKTWATGDVPTAAEFNQYIRDNLDFLHDAYTGDIFSTLVYRGDNSVAGANVARLSKIIVPRRAAITAVRFRVAVTSGNIDVGIYTSVASPVRLWSRGSSACPAVGSASISISAGTPTTLTLDGGVYYLAIAFDNATAAFAGEGSPLSGTSLTKSTSFPLPDPISTPSSNTTANSPYGILAV